MSIEEPTWLIDVSKHQGYNVSFKQAKKEGYAGAIVKMTEGTGYIDPSGALNLDRAIKANLSVGAYHFIWGGMSPRRQAAHFLQQVSLVADPADVMLFVDVEISENMQPSQYPTFQGVRTFLKTLEEKLPDKRLGIYSGYYWRSNMGNPSIDDLRLKRTPIIWDANYFTTAINWGSVLYQAVPRSYWNSVAFGGYKADILQFASTGRLQQFPNGIDVNACPSGLVALQGEEDVSKRWRPHLKSASLVPPGFKPQEPKPKSDIYMERHPTRYRWHTHVQPLIRHLYREFGTDTIHINTYLDHPEGYHRTLDSFDVWGPGGRGDPLPFDVGEKVFDICWNWKGLPDIEWAIYRRKIYSVVNNYEPKPWGDEPFEWHDDHVNQK